MTAIERLTKIPWEIIRSSFFTIKKLAFTYETYDIDAVLPNISVAELKDVLRQEHFVSGEYFSQEYLGEDLNVVQPRLRDDEYKYYQLHVRAFEKQTEKGEVYTELDYHFELDPREKGLAVPHLRGKNFNVDDPTPMVTEILEKHNIEYRVK